MLSAKKEEGNTAFRNKKYQEAYSLYSEALSIDPNNKTTNSKLFCNRATVCSKVSNLLKHYSLFGIDRYYVDT